MAKVMNGELSTKGHMTLDEQRALMKKILSLAKTQGVAEAVSKDHARDEWRAKVDSSRFIPNRKV